MTRALQRLGYCEKAIELKKNIEGSFLDLGELLYNIKEHRMYEPQWSSFEEYCFELKMSSNVIYKLIQIYKTFIIGYGFTHSEVITAGGFSLLQDILPVIKTKKDAMEWLKKSEVLTRSDLRKEIKEQKTGISMTSCKHPETYTVEICKHCNERWQPL